MTNIWRTPPPWEKKTDWLLEQCSPTTSPNSFFSFCFLADRKKIQLLIIHAETPHGCRLRPMIFVGYWKRGRFWNLHQTRQKHGPVEKLDFSWNCNLHTAYLKNIFTWLWNESYPLLTNKHAIPIWTKCWETILKVKKVRNPFLGNNGRSAIARSPWNPLSMTWYPDVEVARDGKSPLWALGENETNLLSPTVLEVQYATVKIQAKHQTWLDSLNVALMSRNVRTEGWAKSRRRTCHLV